MLTLSLLLSLTAPSVWATVPLSPQPMLSILAVEEDRKRGHATYAINERRDVPVEGTEISRERVSSGLWFQFQAGNGFRLDASLQHIHETLSDPEESAALRSPEVARFGTGLSCGLGWTIPIAHWGEEGSGSRSAIGLHVGGTGFFSREGERFAPFAGDSELEGYTVSSALGFEVHRDSAWGLHDLNLLAFLELTPVVGMKSKDLPVGSFEDNPESDSGFGWMRAGLAFQFNWSAENPSPIILSYSAVLEPVDQHTLGIGLAF